MGYRYRDLACCCRLAVLAAVMLGVQVGSAAEPESPPVGLKQRTPWTTSNFRGRPEPPLPYRAERVFPHLSFKHPTVLTSAPGTRRLFVAEQNGNLYSIADDPDCRQADLFLDMTAVLEQLNERSQEPLRLEAVYGFTFHPNFAENRYCYVCYVVRYQQGGKGQHPEGTRVCRYTVSRSDPPVCDVASEETIITWLQGGHNGGCLKFGRDGCLYISTGDGGFAFPPDGRKAGQDLSNLLSAILRIDVDRPSDNKAYSIPSDNPFVDLEGARGEIWAYGLRNPWKMSFDRKTGELWVGDVGWELWELVYRVRKGDNFGWSLTEGNQVVHAEGQRGPTPIVPPTVEIPHTDGASITGGFVYRGQKFPELQGMYIFGDWETRRIWGVPVEGDKVGSRREVVEPTVRIVGFAEDADGELLLLDYDDGTIHALARNDQQALAHRFPTRLSESGIFASVAEQLTAPGVLPFSINAEGWADYATAQRWLGVPGTGAIRLHEKPQAIAGSMFRRSMDFPADTVLVKTLSLALDASRPDEQRPIETQVLHFDGREWRGYTYAWNDQQTDAELVPPAGASRTYTVTDPEAPGGKRIQHWRYPSRMECIRCHNPWAEHTLAFNLPQLNRDHDDGGIQANQIRTLRHIGVLEDVPPERKPWEPEVYTPRSVESLPRLTDPYDASADVDARARSYLHVNCAHCHRFNGGGAAQIQIPFDTPLEKTQAVDVRPTQGTFGIPGARIVATGDPYRSVLYYRLAKTGPGHMPVIGTRLVDRRGLQLIHDWIRQLPLRLDEQAKFQQLTALEEAAALKLEAVQAETLRAQLAYTIAQQAGRETPTEADQQAAEKQAAQQAAANAAERKKQRQQLTDELLASPDTALLLAKAVREQTVSPLLAEEVVTAAAAHTNAAVRELFEDFLPEEKRAKRLGEAIDPAAILALSGDLERGRQLFHQTATVQCRTCHRIGGQGGEIGPDLSTIGKKLNRNKLLESILQPSKEIDPKWATWMVESSSGRVYVGLLMEQSGEKVVIRDAQNQQFTLKPDEIEGMYPSRNSLMPDLLLRDFTAQQVADLLAYLESLK